MYTVEVDDEFCHATLAATGDATVHGVHLPGRLAIKLRGGSTCGPEHVRVTLLHEALHAIDYVYCGGPDAEIPELVRPAPGTTREK